MRISDWSSDVCSSDLDERIDRGVERLALAADIGGRLDRDRAGRDSLARVVLAVPGEIVLACLKRADRDGTERLAGGILDRDAGVGGTFGHVDLAIDRPGRILEGGRARWARIFAYNPGRGGKRDRLLPFT